jgi:hypothetical protein
VKVCAKSVDVAGIVCIDDDVKKRPIDVGESCRRKTMMGMGVCLYSSGYR